MQALFGRHLSGQLRYSSKKITVIFEEKGQITVFLSLLLIVLIGFSFVVVEGVSSYSASALGEDAVRIFLRIMTENSLINIIYFFLIHERKIIFYLMGRQIWTSIFQGIHFLMSSVILLR